MWNVKKTIDRINNIKHQRGLFLHDKERIMSRINKLKRESEDLTEAKMLISEAVRLTQQQLKTTIEQLVTMAISEVFKGEGYQFVVDFTLQGNKPQMKLMVQKEDQEPLVPKDEQGGCLLDVISFALRVVFWSLQRKRSRNTFVMDEPFRWTGAYTENVAEMMKQVSKELGLQIIIVTHDERLKELGDRSWTVKTTSEGCSVVELFGENTFEKRRKRERI